jgi:transcription-repair coupling factor (superfamily II helicase)
MEEEILRISFYRRIMDSRTAQDVENIEQELVDRFGRLPQPSINLLKAIKEQLNSTRHAN